MPCSCLVCTGRGLETLPWYAEHYEKVAILKQKLDSGIIDEYDYEVELHDILHHLVQIAEAVISYSEGKCLYRMRLLVERLYCYKGGEAKSEAQEKLKKVLFEVLVNSDPISDIEYTFSDILMLEEA